VFGYRPPDENPLHDALLAGASTHGVALELNSNGLRKCGEIYPSKTLLERAHALGLPITLASDAHTPDRVGEAFDELAEWARAVGYDSASVYERRERMSYALV
jgi:histidinol-phosphatase (PHP family)